MGGEEEREPEKDGKRFLLKAGHHGNFNSLKPALVVFLEMSATFDRVDHSLLIGRLKQHVTVVAVQWFQSYLSNISQQDTSEGCFLVELVI